MKTTIKLFLALLISSTFFACESYFEGVNENPNAPTEVTEDVMLIALEVELADLYGGEISRNTSMLIQHVEGVARCGSFYFYTAFQQPAAYNTQWQNVYTNILNEANILRAQAQKNGLKNYEAVANILLAFQLMQATDLWGDMPWSEANQGIDNLTPKYDTQEQIYQELNQLLDDAIQLIEQNGAAINGDLIYFGDMERWKKAAYGLKARAALRWTGIDATNYEIALNAVQQSFTSSLDDMTIQFGAEEDEAAPMFRFFRDRTGDMEFNPYFRNEMLSRNDSSRLALLDVIFTEAHPYFVSDFDQPLMTYRELKFIEAECLLQLNRAPQEIHDAYKAGVESTFEHYGFAADFEAYFAQDVINPGVGNITLEHILWEKGIAIYSQPEAFHDWRRTDYPEITPTSGQQVPIRFLYPETEILFNPNTPINIDLFEDKVAWDVN